MTYAQAKDLQDRLNAEMALREASGPVIERLAHKLAHLCDDQFVDQFCLAAAKGLDADMVLVGRLNPFSNIVRTICFVSDDAITEPFTYSLDGTPCEQAVNGGACIYRSNVAQEFPHDRILVDFDIDAYAGEPLIGENEETIGVLVALKKTPIDNPALYKSVLSQFSPRVAAAIEAREARERLSWAVRQSMDGLWDWDVLTGSTTLSEEIKSLLGFEKNKGPYDLAQIERAIHPDDRNKHVEALQNHLNHGAVFDVQIRLRDRNGAYRWFRSRGKAIRGSNGKLMRMIGCFIDIDDLMIAARKGQIAT